MAQEQVKKFLGKITPEDHGGKPRSVIFTLGNGQSIVAELDKLDSVTVERLAVHGLSQKIGDAASSFSKDRDFLGAFASLSGVWETLQAGGWNQKGGGGTSDLVAAVAKLKGVSLEEAQAAIDKANEEQLAALKKHPAIKAEIAEIQKKRAKEAAKTAGSLEDLTKAIGL